MKILLYDPFAGISGDMNIGALADLGVPEEYFIETVKNLRLHGAGISFTRGERKGISGISAVVTDSHGIADENPPHSHHHPHRNLDDIKKIISESVLSEGVKEKSVRIFTTLAEAEAKVHGMDIISVHFHETGAVDSIVDIVCAAAAVEYLAPERIVSRPVELGSGFVKCAHGLLPVPAPATAALVENIPFTAGRVNHEATTPTGAAIIKTLSDSFVSRFSGRILKTGCGLGSRDVEIPNILRVMLIETDDEKKELNNEEALVMECNIDDMNPELYGNVMEKLFNAGAKDVFMTPVYMKKNRPGILLTTVLLSSDEDAVRETMFLETTTAGIRSYTVSRDTLEREESYLETSFGRVRVKKLFYRGKCISAKPEYEDMLRIASEKKLPLKELYERVNE